MKSLLTFLFFLGLVSCSTETEDKRTLQEYTDYDRSFNPDLEEGFRAAKKILLAFGEGDCDNSHECKKGLRCVNVKNGKLESKKDGISQPGHEVCDFLAGNEGFEIGEGDCDRSEQCQAGLVCMNKNGKVETRTRKQPGPETCQRKRKK